jgi:hypothetical protein
MVSQAPAIRSAVARMRAVLAAAIVVAFALTLSTAAGGATITVNSLADTGVAGMCVLRDAITAANTVAATNGCIAGTGNDTINFSVIGTITVSSTLPRVTDPLLTINGPASPGITIDGGGAVQVMQVASGATLKLKNLAIAHGFAADGGAILNDGTVTVTNSIFSGNSASRNDGGCIFNNAATLTVTNSTFSRNSAIANGGGISNFVGTLTVTNSTFSGNTGEFGGGILNYTLEPGLGTASVSNSTFSGNSTSDADGGGIYNAGTLTVNNSTFSRNNAARWGGGILNIKMLLVTNSTFSGNSADAVIGSEGDGVAAFPTSAGC